MQTPSLRSVAALAALFLVAACAEPVTEPAVETGGAAPVADAPAADALPEVVYYKISDS